MRNLAKNANLFPDFFRQHIDLGVFSVVLAALLSALYAVMQFRLEFEAGNTAVTYASTLFDAMQVGVLVLYLWVLVATFQFHRLLNRKENVDFYFSLPVSRTHLLLQYLADVLLWSVLILLVSAVSAVLTVYMVTHGELCILPGSVIPTLLGVLAASLFFMTALAIGVVATGAGMNALILGVSVAIGPRLALYAIKYFITSGPAVLAAPSADWFLSPRMNTFLDSFRLMVSGDYMVGHITTLTNRNFTWSGILWTFLTAVIYLAIALALFHRRKAEVGNTKVGVHAAAFGAVFGLNLFTVQAVYGWFYPNDTAENLLVRSVDEMGTATDNRYWMGALLVVLGTALLFFVYEWIFQRDWKKAARSFWVFGLALLTNAILLGIMVGVTHAKLSYQPEEQDIQSVSLTSRRLGDWSEQEAYYREVLGTWGVSDETISKVVSNALQRTPAQLEKLMNTSSYEPLEARIVSGGRGHYRAIYLTDKEYETVIKALTTHKELSGVLRELPPEKDILHVSFAVEDIFLNANYTLTAEEQKTLLRLVREDWKNLSSEHLLVSSGLLPGSWESNASSDLLSPSTFYLTVQKNGSPYLFSIDILSDMPKSYAYVAGIYKGAIHKSSDKLLETLTGNQKKLKEVLESGSKDLSIEVNTVQKDPDDPSWTCYETAFLAEDFASTGISPKELAEYLKTLEVLDTVPTKADMPPYITVVFTEYDPELGYLTSSMGASYRLPSNSSPDFLKKYLDESSTWDDGVKNDLDIAM